MFPLIFPNPYGNGLTKFSAVNGVLGPYFPKRLIHKAIGKDGRIRLTGEWVNGTMF